MVKAAAVRGGRPQRGLVPSLGLQSSWWREEGLGHGRLVRPCQHSLDHERVLETLNLQGLCHLHIQKHLKIFFL